MRALGALLVLAAAAVAEPDPVALLASEDPQERAWGAYRAGEKRLEVAVPALRELLARERSFATVALALDALIRLKAPVQWDEVRPHFGQHAAGVLVLLAQRPDECPPELVTVLDTALARVHWRAAVNLLARIRAPGLAARLSKDLECRLHLAVVDPGRLGGAAGGGGRGFGAGTRKILLGDGWPPIPLYVLSGEQAGEAFAPGPFAVFYERVVHQRDPSFRREGPRRVESDHFKALRFLLEVKRLPYEETVETSLEWTGAGALRAAVARERASAVERYGELLGLLREHRLLTADEAKALEPRIRVHLHDLREDRSTPLPEE